MSAKSERKKHNKQQKQSEAKQKTAIVEQVVQNEDDETLGRYDFRLIKDEEKPRVVFNDGDLAFTIEFVRPENRTKDTGIIYSAAQFRTMTNMTAGEFKAALPVHYDAFWHNDEPNENGKTKLDIFESMIRQGWEEKLKGDALFNDGDRAVLVMLLNDGEEGMDVRYRKDTDLTQVQFLEAYPLLPGFDSWTAEMTDKFCAKVDELEKTWEAGRQRVIELAKKHELVESKCTCGDCENTGFTLLGTDGEEVCLCCQEAAFTALYNDLRAEGFVRNAEDVANCITSVKEKKPPLFVPLPEAPSQIAA